MRSETIARLKCTRCKHVWLPRRLKLPKVCPRCKRYDWDGKRNGRKL